MLETLKRKLVDSAPLASIMQLLYFRPIPSILRPNIVLAATTMDLHLAPIG
jgi:hypothetical protein